MSTKTLREFVECGTEGLPVMATVRDGDNRNIAKRCMFCMEEEGAEGPFWHKGARFYACKACRSHKSAQRWSRKIAHRWEDLHKALDALHEATKVFKRHRDG